MLDLRKDIKNNKLTINLAGEMDLSNHMVFIHVIEDINNNAYSKTLIDLQNLSFMDSTAINTFINVSKLLMNNGNKTLRIVNVCKNIEKIFNLLNVEGILGKEVFL